MHTASGLTVVQESTKGQAREIDMWKPFQLSAAITDRKAHYRGASETRIVSILRIPEGTERNRMFAPKITCASHCWTVHGSTWEHVPKHQLAAFPVTNQLQAAATSAMG